MDNASASAINPNLQATLHERDHGYVWMEQNPLYHKHNHLRMLLQS